MKIDVENPQAVLEDILTRINNRELIDADTISNEIARLRVNSCLALKGFDYTKKNGEQDYKVIVTRMDRAYWKALDDIEEALLGKEKG